MSLSCNGKNVIPNEKMFALGMDELNNIQANQTFEINGYLKNKSKYTWQILHGADLFTYEIYDESGTLIPYGVSMTYVNSIGYTKELKGLEIYKNNGEGQRSKETYQFKLANPGKYKVKLMAEFAVQVGKNKYDQLITSKDYEFEVK